MGYDPHAAVDRSASGYVDVRCTCSILLLDCVAFAYNVEIQLGTATSATTRELKRTGGSGSLRYGLYKDALRQNPFGVGSQGVGAFYLLTLFGSNQRIPVYGSIPAGQSTRPGEYTDAPTILITY